MKERFNWPHLHWRQIFWLILFFTEIHGKPSLTWASLCSRFAKWRLCTSKTLQVEPRSAVHFDTELCEECGICGCVFIKKDTQTEMLCFHYLSFISAGISRERLSSMFIRSGEELCHFFIILHYEDCQMAKNFWMENATSWSEEAICRKVWHSLCEHFVKPKW